MPSKAGVSLSRSTEEQRLRHFHAPSFCAGFERQMERRDNNWRTLWRVVDEKDVVARVPPGLADVEEMRLFLKPYSILNYGFIGTEINLNKDAPYFYSIPSKGVRVGDLVQITESDISFESHDRPEGTGAGPVVEHETGRAADEGAVVANKEAATIVALVSLLMAMFIPWLRDRKLVRPLKMNPRQQLRLNSSSAIPPR